MGEAPFDSGRKMMSTIHRTADGFVQYTKGAPDEVLKKCTHYRKDGKVLPLDEAGQKEILSQNKAMADQALRVLAAAERHHDAMPSDQSPEALEHDLVFLGLAGMIDPIRPEVKDAIAECKTAGIRAVMITGDHRDTAVAIARQLGILEHDDQAITGAQLNQMSDEELDRNIRHYSVYARVQPEHKVRIVNAWKKQGCITATLDQRVRPLHQVRRHRRGHGHHRHRRDQERGGHGPGRRQLRHHRGRRQRGPPDLRQHAQGHPVPAGVQHERGSSPSSWPPSSASSFWSLSTCCGST